MRIWLKSFNCSELVHQRHLESLRNHNFRWVLNLGGGNGIQNLRQIAFMIWNALPISDDLPFQISDHLWVPHLGHEFQGGRFLLVNRNLWDAFASAALFWNGFSVVFLLFILMQMSRDLREMQIKGLWQGATTAKRLSIDVDAKILIDWDSVAFVSGWNCVTSLINRSLDFTFDFELPLLRRWLDRSHLVVVQSIICSVIIWSHWFQRAHSVLGANRRQVWET